MVAGVERDGVDAGAFKLVENPGGVGEGNLSIAVWERGHLQQINGVHLKVAGAGAFYN